jgi:hypothetical protein
MDEVLVLSFKSTRLHRVLVTRVFSCTVLKGEEGLVFDDSLDGIGGVSIHRSCFPFYCWLVT